MQQFLRVLRASILKEIRIWKRNKTKLGLAVLSPLMFWAGFTVLMGGVYSQGIEAGLVVLEDNPGYYTNGLIEVLGEPDDIPPSLNLISMDEDTAQSLIETGDILLVIIIPDGFESALENNETTSIEIWVNNIHEDLTKNVRMPVIRKLDIFYQTYLPESSLVDFDYELLRDFTYPRLGYMAWTMSIYAVMFGAMFAAGSSMTQEFEDATFDEIELSNQSPIAIHSGKILVGSCIGYVAPPVLIVLGWLGYGVWPNGDVLIYLLLTYSLAVFSASIGVILGALSRHSVYVVPLAALSSLFYWIMGGGMAPMLLAGIQIDLVDNYSPISNAYRSLTTMFIDGVYTTLLFDLAVIGGFAIALLVIAPMIAIRLARIDYSHRIEELKRRRKR
ncbi:MAG: ABC transporter permease [Candidatus Thorarchaeota archaeon]